MIQADNGKNKEAEDDGVMKNCAKSIRVDESRETYICTQLFQWKDLVSRHTCVDLLGLGALGRCTSTGYYFKHHLDSK